MINDHWSLINTLFYLNYMQEAKRRRVRHESEPSFIRKTYSIGDTVGIRIPICISRIPDPTGFQFVLVGFRILLDSNLY